MNKQFEKKHLNPAMEAGYQKWLKDREQKIERLSKNWDIEALTDAELECLLKVNH